MPDRSPATYGTDAIGRTISKYACSCHGILHPSRAIMLLHTREFKRRIARDLQALVREGTLGQNCWDRLPGETPLQYRRFQIFLTHRTIGAVCKITGATESTMKQMSHKWSWVFRAIAYDDHLTRQAMAEYEAEKKKSARRQAVLGRRLQDAALVGASQLIGRVESGDVEMTGNEIAKLADVGVKIERLGNSDPTAIKEDRGIHFVWEGPRPSWAPADPVADARPVLEATIGDGSNG